MGRLSKKQRGRVSKQRKQLEKLAALTIQSRVYPARSFYRRHLEGIVSLLAKGIMLLQNPMELSSLFAPYCSS
jgi:hypothetical protein